MPAKGTIPRTCEQCGVSFFSLPSTPSREKGKYCSRECLYEALKRRVACTCEHCGTVFHVRPTDIRKGRGRFCSKSCARKGPRGGSVESTCLSCGKIFKTFVSRIEHHTGLYCSRECFAASMRGVTGPDSPRWRGGKTLDRAKNYVIVSVDGRSIYEHRLVMERMLGRPLTSDEIVHHRDGNGLNNLPENLRLVDRVEHGRIHFGKDSKGDRWAREYDACVNCGRTDRPHNAHGLCKRCDDNRRYHERKTLS